jgi:phosphoribosylglycinamide formyltransferase 1
MVLKIAVLASTNGTDLQAIIDEIKNKSLDADLRIVIANKECYAITRAKEQGFNTEVVLYDKENYTRESFDNKISKIIDDNQVELIVLVGYMRLFSPWFVNKYKNKIMNIHPSILPSFPGMDRSVHKEVLEYGCKVTGCTIHFVDEGTDTGPIIMQETVLVENDETIDSLKTKVQNLEKKLYPIAIKKFAERKIKVDGKKVHVD